MFSKKLTTETKHRRYRCKVCSKEDRKGRLIGHVLKYHVPMDRVPFSCSLCNFRCTDRATLANHLSSYQRHRDEVMRSGVTDLTTILNKSPNPIDATSLIVAVEAEPALAEFQFGVGDESIFDALDTQDPCLPDWLADFAAIQTPAQFQPSRSPANGSATQTTGVGVLFQASPFRAQTDNVLAAGIKTNVLPTSQAPGPLWHAQPVWKPSMPVSASRRTPLIAAQGPTTVNQAVLPIQSAITTPVMGTLDRSQLTSLQLGTIPVQQTTLTKEVTGKATSTIDSTPLLDENIFTVSDDPLDQSYTQDPLFLEGRHLESKPKDSKEESRKSQPTHSQARTSTSTAGVEARTRSQEVGLADILRAIESNGSKLHAVNRNLRNLQDEVHGLQRALFSLERTCARANAPAPRPRPPKRSRTPSPQNSRKGTCPEKKNTIKSVVKKPKGK